MQSYYTNSMLASLSKIIQHADSFISRRNHTILTMCLLRSQENIHSMPVLLTTFNIKYCRSYYTNYTLRSQAYSYKLRRTFESQTYTIVAYITSLTMCFLRSEKVLDNNGHPYIYYNAQFKSPSNDCR